MSQQKFVASEIAPKQAGWDTQVNDAITLLNQHLGTFPTQLRAAYRVSASNPDPDTYLNLVSLDPAIFEGHMVFVRDPGGAGAPTVRATYAFSDGTDWIWWDNDNDVAGIA